MITHGVVQYPRDSGGKLPYILHYGIDFNIGDSYNWNPMVYNPNPNPNDNPNPNPNPNQVTATTGTRWSTRSSTSRGAREP